MATKTITRIHPLSVSKYVGAFYALIGLVVGILSAVGLGDFPVSGIGMGIAVIVLAPIIYGAVGFLIGGLGALIYNGVTNYTGGIKVDLK